MYIPPLEYTAPTTIGEALAALRKTNGAVPLAGGTDLVVMMKEGRAAPAGVVSLRKLAELKRLSIENGMCHLGSRVTVSQIGRSELCKNNPGFADMVHTMANQQIRNRATVGGNLCTAAACADIPPILLVNDATVTIAGVDGARTIPLAKFFTGPRQTVLQRDELLLKVSCKANNPGTAYIKFGPRKVVNIAIVGVAVALTVEHDAIASLRVAVTAASPTPMLFTEPALQVSGADTNDATWNNIASRVVEQLSPISDIRGSADYRRQLAHVGVVRGCQTALSRLESTRGGVHA